MYKRILVPLDGSEIAEGILPVVESFAQALNARVHLLSVIEEDVVAAVAHPLQGRFADQARMTAVGVAEEYVKKVAARLQLPKNSVDVTVKVASVPETILEEAEKQPETLLAMSTHGRSGMQRFVLGSVADKLLHATKAPLLLDRPREEMISKPVQRLTTVIVPLDGSELAEKVLPHVAALAKALQLKVLLVRVTTTMVEYYSGEGFYTIPQQLITDMEKSSEDYLSDKVLELENQGCKDVSGLALIGSPTGQVIDLIKKTPNSFAAVSTHGRSGLGRWVLGSVADRVIQQSGSPVLVIR